MDFVSDRPLQAEEIRSGGGVPERSDIVTRGGWNSELVQNEFNTLCVLCSLLEVVPFANSLYSFILK